MKKTSEKWQKICQTTVLDPDGWDRKNFDFSWCIEKITRKEFERRLSYSTARHLPPWGSCMWKDHPYREFWLLKKFFSRVIKRVFP